MQGTFEQPIVAQNLGRPPKTFTELSERSKRRKTEDLRSTTSKEMLLHAAQITLQTSGHRTASQMLKEVVISPNHAKKYKTAYIKSMRDNRGNKLTTLCALSMFVEADLSRRQYEIIRDTNKNVYPCYSLLQKAKQDCYPPKESYHVTATSAELNIQNLMDHTVQRLLLALEEVLHTLTEEDRKTLQLICKWGCDGSQQAQFKQKIDNDSDDSNIFQSSFVPLQLICDTQNRKIVWQNPTPSSPRYCRPIRIRFVKESVDITNDEISYVENAANLLENTNISMGDKNYSVKHTMMLTMIDGKVCNAATLNTSTMRCYICGLTSKHFNDLTNKGDVKIESLKFGLSVLHARIRLFESLLHLAYKLPIKKWQIRASDTVSKEIVKNTKREIQERFRKEIGLIVDVPKAGFGNTNDGNSSRRFFADPKLAAEITGIDFNLIFRFKVILQVISSGHKVNVQKFSEYCMDTAKLYVQIYPWHPMTPTQHKILVHGAAVIESALLPIGQLSEEAAEARNKHFRLYRQNYARKFSREACNLDVLNRLLLTSDPLITSMRPKPKRKNDPFLKEALELLMPADPTRLIDECGDASEEVESSEGEISSDEEV